MFSKATYPVSISDITIPVKSFSDKVFGGNKNFSSSRNIFLLKEIFLYKNQIISLSKDGTFLNIIGSKAEKRNYKNNLSPICRFRIFRARVIENKKNNFFFYSSQQA